jgi:hypothetical protein
MGDGGMTKKPTCECGECRPCRRRAHYQTLTPEERRLLRDGADPERARARERARYYRDRKKRAALGKRWREENRERAREIKREWAARHPEKVKASQAVSNAIRDGRMVKGPCEVCGTTERIEGHHDDYSKPLDVRWLCVPHHAEHHRPYGPPTTEFRGAPWAA